MKKMINYSWEELQKDCEFLVKELEKQELLSDIHNVYGIPRGGLIPAVIISHLLNKPLVRSEKQIGLFTLIVDDISDTGDTLLNLLNHEAFVNYKPITATLWINKNTKFRPTVYCKTKEESEWIKYPFETLLTSKKDN